MYFITKELFDILKDLDFGKYEIAYLVEDDFGNCVVFTQDIPFVKWVNWSCAKFKPSLKRWYHYCYGGKASIQDERVRDIFLTK